MGRRVLVTGADTFWGGRVISALEEDPNVEVLLGLGDTRPSVKFERAEFVHADATYSILNRLVRATEVDTIVHTFLVVDSTLVAPRALNEINVIGTMNLLAAAGAPGSKVKHLIVKSSALVYGSTERDPNTFKEQTPRMKPARTRIERSLIEAEQLIREFADDHPEITVTVLRFCNVLGTDLTTPLSRNLSRRLCPSLLGYDPMLQFIAEEDVVDALLHATHHRLPGVYNVAGKGRIPWSEVMELCGTKPLPLPRLRAIMAVAPKLPLVHYEMPDELEDLLRFGRGIATRKFIATGFKPQFSTAGAVEHFAEGLRLSRSMHMPSEENEYDHAVEQFFRHSPAVKR